MWIYRYLRADRVEIDTGPYETKDEAQKAADYHASIGAITTPAFEVADDHEIYKGEEE